MPTYRIKAIITTFCAAFLSGGHPILGADAAASPYDPQGYISKQEFEQAKREEIANATLRYSVIEVDGKKALKLQTEKGAIVLDFDTEFTRDELLEARCSDRTVNLIQKPISTKAEYDLEKAVKERSEVLAAVIEYRCAHYTSTTRSGSDLPIILKDWYDSANDNSVD